MPDMGGSKAVLVRSFPHPMSRIFRFTLLMSLLALAAAACGGDDGADPTTTSAAAVTTTSSTTTSTTKAPVTTITEPVDTTELLIMTEWSNTVDGKFEHTGGAVDAGVMCTEGRFKYSVEAIDEDPGKWLDSVSTAEYTCTDGSGTFTTESTYHTIISGANSSVLGLWEVLEGTGAYATIQGGGTLDGDCAPQGCVAEGIGVVTP
jgi:hypothetical protein